MSTKLAGYLHDGQDCLLIPLFTNATTLVVHDIEFRVQILTDGLRLWRIWEHTDLDAKCLDTLLNHNHELERRREDITYHHQHATAVLRHTEDHTTHKQDDHVAIRDMHLAKVRQMEAIQSLHTPYQCHVETWALVLPGGQMTRFQHGMMELTLTWCPIGSAVAHQTIHFTEEHAPGKGHPREKRPTAIASGSGLLRTTLGSTSTFSVETHQPPTEQLKVTINGGEAHVSVTDQGDGIYHVNYMMYSILPQDTTWNVTDHAIVIAIRIGEDHIPGSPFRVNAYHAWARMDIDRDGLYITNEEFNCISIFGKTGRLVGACLGTGPVELLATDDTMMYTRDQRTDVVQVFTKHDGHFVEERDAELWKTTHHPRRNVFTGAICPPLGDNRLDIIRQGTRVAKDDTHAYILHYTARRVDVFTHEGMFVTSIWPWKIRDDHYHSSHIPVTMVVDDTSIYISDYFQHQIQVCTKDGSLTRIIGKGKLVFPNTMAVDNMFLYVSSGTVISCFWKHSGEYINSAG